MYVTKFCNLPNKQDPTVDRPQSVTRLTVCRKYGQKKSWHLVGLVCVLASFPFIFMPCISCSTSDGWAQLIYYSAFAVIFQFGWASMQVGHWKYWKLSSMMYCECAKTYL